MNPFAVIAEPNRRRLLEGLKDGPQPVSVLVDRVGLSQPAVSKHLRILKDAGFVTVEPDGQRRLYHINPSPFEELHAWLAPYRELWSDRLAALERHLDTHTEERKR